MSDPVTRAAIIREELPTDAAAKLERVREECEKYKAFPGLSAPALSHRLLAIINGGEAATQVLTDSFRKEANELDS